jgi:uncharacterized protein YndB with AHSA1/START domain
MPKIEASVVVHRPVEELWRFITDWSNSPKWDVGIVEMKQTSTGPFGVGATFTQIRRSTPKETDMRVIEYVLNRKLVFEVPTGPGKGSKFTFEMQDVDGKARFTETDDYKWNGFYRVLAPFFGGTLRRNCASRVGNIKRILETEAPS